MDATHFGALRRYLEECDVRGVRALWAHVAPGMPIPRSDKDVLVSIHRARTEMVSIPLRLRLYSHRWLIDRGWPSGLPDELKPMAERIYPRNVESVGVSINFRSKAIRGAKPIVERAVSDAVEDCFADKKTDPSFIRKRIVEVKDFEIRKLFGRSVLGAG